MMTPLRIVFLVVFLAIVAGLNVYLYRRLVRDVTGSRRARIAGGVILALLVLLVPGIRLGFAGELPPAWLTTAVVAFWGFTLFTLMALVAADLTRWVARRVRPAPPPVDPERRLFLARATAAGALVAGGSAATFGAWRAYAPPRVTEVPVRLPGLPAALSGFTIVHLTDIHVGPVIQERFVDQLVSVVNGARPDLVAITGDLVDGSPDQLGRYVARFSGLRSREGTFFVSGNHDYYSGWDRWSRALPSLAGFTLLRNRHVSIGDAGASFDLVGVEDWGGPGGSNSQYDLEAATRGRDPSRAGVLLCHQPQNLEAASQKQLGLQLSGHTHGGQLFPGTVVGELIWGPRNAGLSTHGMTTLYTSRGCGFVGPPMRVGADPEVVKIVLLPA